MIPYFMAFEGVYSIISTLDRVLARVTSQRGMEWISV
jgi:hypothetical protein